MTHGDAVTVNVVALIKSYVAKNFGVVSWTGCTDPAALAVVPDPGETCISFDALPPQTQLVRVTLPRRQYSTLFAGIANVFQITIRASAVATVGHPRAVVTQPCALCTLGNTDLQVGSIDLQNGDIGGTGGAVATRSRASPMPRRMSGVRSVLAS